MKHNVPGAHLLVSFWTKGIHLVCSKTSLWCEPKYIKWGRRANWF